ncbi:YqgE/AlgH family protein [Chryseobacterium carnipullorum]|uniref:YqgE/AlgH family protein n=1 Tax=Chryseobacterium carnipullorum TaxID=1124835 RepID=UPI0037446411
MTEIYSEINKEFYITEDIESIISAVLNKELSIHDVKIFSGYSGWAAEQLNEEVLRKMWTVVDVYNLDYTLPNDQTLWKSIMQNLGGEYLLWANSPEDISLN